MPGKGKNTEYRASRAGRGSNPASSSFPALRPRARISGFVSSQPGPSSASSQPGSSAASSRPPVIPSSGAGRAGVRDSSSDQRSSNFTPTREINRGLYVSGKFTDPARPKLELPVRAKAKVAAYSSLLPPTDESRRGSEFPSSSGRTVTQPGAVEIQNQIAALDRNLRDPQGVFQDTMRTAHTYMTGIRLIECATATNADTARKTLMWLHASLNESERTLWGLQEKCTGATKRADLLNRALAFVKLQRDMLSTYPDELATADFKRRAKWEEWRKLNEESHAAFQRDEAERKARGQR